MLSTWIRLLAAEGGWNKFGSFHRDPIGRCSTLPWVDRQSDRVRRGDNIGETCRSLQVGRPMGASTGVCTSVGQS